MEAPLLPQLNFNMEDDDVQMDVAPSVSANGEGGPSPSTAPAPPWAMSPPPVPEAVSKIPLHLRFEGIQQAQLCMADVSPLVVSPLPQSPRRIRVCPSIISQIDAGLFKLYNVRLERDVMAGSDQESYTTFYGLPPYLSISMGTNLFVHDPELMPRVVNTAARHRANGVFIVPQLAGPPMLLNRDKPTPWLHFLLAKASFVFILPPDAVTGLGPNFISTPFLGVFVRFGTLPRFKAKFHEERTLGYLTLQCTPYSSSVIATNPFMLIRMSALAHNLAPTLASDTAPRRKQAWPSSRASLPAQQVCPFNITLFRSLTNTYPYPDVVEYVLAVLEASQDFFVGDRSKPVDMEPRHHPPNPYGHAEGCGGRMDTRAYICASAAQLATNSGRLQEEEQIRFTLH